MQTEKDANQIKKRCEEITKMVEQAEKDGCRIVDIDTGAGDAYEWLKDVQDR